MDDIKNVEKWVLDDGRRAEKRVTEVKNEDGQGERVIELHIEDARPMRLQQRVVEKTKPFVFERMVSTVDPQTGEVVDQKLESIEPKIQMQLVEHISTTNPNVSTLNVDDCDCHVTKEEMIETVIAAVKAAKDNERPMSRSMSSNSFSDKLNSLGLVDEIEKRVDISGYSSSDKILIVVIAAQVIVLGYIIFFF